MHNTLSSQRKNKHAVLESPPRVAAFANNISSTNFSEANTLLLLLPLLLLLSSRTACRVGRGCSFFSYHHQRVRAGHDYRNSRHFFIVIFRSSRVGGREAGGGSWDRVRGIPSVIAFVWRGWCGLQIRGFVAPSFNPWELERKNSVSFSRT